MNKKISVIVSAYNIEDYIFDCLDSIAKQTYCSIDVVIINDGSTDNTLNVVNNFCKADPRFRVYSKKNGGPSSARNYGMKKITGDYFIFVDGDDVLDKNCIKALYDACIDTKSTIAICDYEKFDKQFNPCEKAFEYSLFSRNEYYKEIISFRKNTYVWGIIYPASFKEIISFPNKRYFEDLAVFPQILKNCEQICFVNQKYAKYRQNQNSIVHAYNPNKIKDYLEYSKVFAMNSEATNANDECKIYLANAYMTSIYLSIKNDESKYKEYKYEIKRLLTKTKIRKIGGALGFKIRLFKVSPSLGCFALKNKKRFLR